MFWLVYGTVNEACMEVTVGIGWSGCVFIGIGWVGEGVFDKWYTVLHMLTLTLTMIQCA